MFVQFCIASQIQSEVSRVFNLKSFGVQSRCAGLESCIRCDALGGVLRILVSGGVVGV